jgi:Protein of unknown function (DUF5818)
MREPVPNRFAFAVFVPSTLHLVGSGGCAPEKTIRKTRPLDTGRRDGARNLIGSSNTCMAPDKCCTCRSQGASKELATVHTLSYQQKEYSPRVTTVDIGAKMEERWVESQFQPNPAFYGCLLPGFFFFAGSAHHRYGLVKEGDKYVLQSAGISYQLDDQEKAKKFEGQQVKVNGDLDKSTKTIRVSDIAAVK